MGILSVGVTAMHLKIIGGCENTECVGIDVCTQWLWVCAQG